MLLKLIYFCGTFPWHCSFHTMENGLGPTHWCKELEKNRIHSVWRNEILVHGKGFSPMELLCVFTRENILYWSSSITLYGPPRDRSLAVCKNVLFTQCYSQVETGGFSFFFFLNRKLNLFPEDFFFEFSRGKWKIFLLKVLDGFFFFFVSLVSNFCFVFWV